MEFGYVTNIQHFSLNDGNGIRSIIFLAGCPLRCAWCANPEAFTNKEASIRNVKDIVDETLRYKVFLKKSGGGITFSGGECTVQFEFLSELVNEYYDLNINLAVETSGYFDFNKVKDIFKKIDIIFVDIKHMDRNKHKEFTGVDNQLILENIKKLTKVHNNIVIRIPVVVGVNATETNIRDTAKFVCKYIDNPRIELLPYHTLGEKKYEMLNMTKPSNEFKIPEKKLVTRLKNIIEEENVKSISFK